MGSGTHGEQTAAVLVGIERILQRERPGMVIVAGDVNSTLGAGLAAAKQPVLLTHLEAGLRSGDWSMPEEVNRVVTDRVSDLLLCHSPSAVDNLLAEGISRDRIALVGNTMIDSLFALLDSARAAGAVERLGLSPRGYVLVTLHRPALVDDPGKLADVLRVLDEVAVDLPVEAEARLVVTDSGGVQEEISALGVPCLTYRTSTERPITVELGTNRLVGVDPVELRTAYLEPLDAPEPTHSPSIPLWDGYAGGRAADSILALGWRRSAEPQTSAALDSE